MYCRFVRKNSIVCYRLHTLFQHLLVDLDVILATDGNFLLGKWIREARKQGKNIKSWTHLTIPCLTGEKGKKGVFDSCVLLRFWWIIYTSRCIPSRVFLWGCQKWRGFFFFSSEDFSPPRSAFVFFCTPRPEKKHRMGKRGARLRNWICERKRQTENDGRKSKTFLLFFHSSISGNRKLLNSSLLTEQQPVSKVFGNPFGTFVFFLPQQASGAGRATSTNSTREIRQLNIP